MSMSKDMWIAEHECALEDFASGEITREECEGRLKALGLDQRDYKDELDQIEDDLTNEAEAAWERQQEEGFRGNEAAAYQAEQQAKIQRTLK